MSKNAEAYGATSNTVPSLPLPPYWGKAEKYAVVPVEDSTQK
jgi:hypothetical protein